MSTHDPEAAANDGWAGANPFLPSFRDDPYPALNHLREADPVNQTPLGPWRVSRYDDVAHVLKSAPASMTASDGTAPNFDPEDKRGSFLEFMLDKDGETHNRLRRLVTQAFTRRALEKIEHEVENAVTTALDNAIAQGGWMSFTTSRCTCRAA